ncbi:MAG: hypothetical protein P8Y53_10300 [Pseudolabrys sp.]
MFAPFALLRQSPFRSLQEATGIAKMANPFVKIDGLNKSVFPKMIARRHPQMVELV